MGTLHQHRMVDERICILALINENRVHITPDKPAFNGWTAMTELTTKHFNNSAIDDHGGLNYFPHEPIVDRVAVSRIERDGVIYEVRVIAQIVPITRTPMQRPFLVDLSQRGTSLATPRRIPIRDGNVGIELQ